MRMLNKLWLKSTLEWVLVVAAGSVLSAMFDGGIHSWADLGQAAGTAALVALLKSIVASQTGQGSASLVEPPVKVRVAYEPPPRRPPPWSKPGAGERPLERGPEL